MFRVMKPVVLLALAASSLLGCTTVPTESGDGSTQARIGKQVIVGGPKVTVLKVLEDSRCPAEVDCFWAGRVRIEVRVETGQGNAVKELATDQPAQVADGQLELAGVMPARRSTQAIAPQDYRFSLRFSGGF